MLRNLLASAILLASTSAFATIAEDLKAEGATSASVVDAALSACTDADCKAAVLAEAIEAGIDTKSVMSIALASGVEAKAVSSALLKAGVSQQDIIVAGNDLGLSPADLAPATAGGNPNQPPAGDTGKKDIPASEVPNGIS